MGGGGGKRPVRRGGVRRGVVVGVDGVRAQRGRGRVPRAAPAARRVANSDSDRGPDER